MTKQRRAYRPDLVLQDDGDFEQRFTAELVNIDDNKDFTQLAFGDLPLHQLLVTLPAVEAAPSATRSISVEFNDQGNDTDAVERIEIGPDHLRIRFAGGLAAGRASMAPEHDELEDEIPDDNDDRFADVERFDDVRLSSICVRLDLAPAVLATLTRHLERCADLYDLELAGPLSELPTPAAPEPLEITVYLDADVIDGFCYGQPWARDLSDAARTRVLEAIRDLYIATIRVPPDIALDWHLIPDRRMAGPFLSDESETVREALDEAAHELRFGSSSDRVLPALRAAAG